MADMQAGTHWVFENSDAIIETKPSKKLDLTEALTLEAWVCPEKLPSGGARIIDKSVAGTSEGYCLDTYPGNSLRLIVKGATIHYDAKLPVAEWSHVAGTVDAKNGIIKLYVNGKEVAKSEGDATISTTSIPLRFGSDSAGSNRYRGKMARASVFSRALNAEEVAKLSEKRATVDAASMAGCVGSWGFVADEDGKGLFQNAVENGPEITMDNPALLIDAAPAPANAMQCLWYRTPAADWNSALPLGNGRLGAMVFGGIKSERLQCNEDTLWAGKPHCYDKKGAYKFLPEIQKLVFAGKLKEATALSDKEFMSDPLYQKPYQPLVDIEMDFPDVGGSIKKYRRELDLENGVVRVQYELNGVQYVREAFISSKAQVIAVHVSTSKVGALNMSAGLTCQHSNKIDAEGASRLVLKGRCGEDGISFETCLSAILDGKEGQIKAQNGKIDVQNATSVTFLLVAATSFKKYDDISGNPAKIWRPQLDAAEKRAYGELLGEHCVEHSAWMRRVDLSLETASGDDAIEPRKAMLFPTDERLKAIQQSHGKVNDPHLIVLYTQLGRYLLLGASRPGTQTANLQGIWNKDTNPPWGSKYTININIEMNYWGAEMGNLAECHTPLFDMLDDLRVTGANTAKEYYNARGFVAHHNTDLWRGAAAIDGVWGVWPMSAAWMARHPYEHYLFSLDKEFLEKRAWPIMREAALFILDFLIEAPAGSPVEGYLVTCPSHSPENTFVRADGGRAQLTYAATMDLMIIRDLFENCLNAAKVLGKEEDEFTKEVSSALKRLAPLQISQRDGRLQEWVEDYKDAEPGHRHMSHFYALHPGNQITPRGTPKLAAALRKSLDTRLANGGGGTGWSRAWLMNFAARFEDPVLAWENTQKILERSTLPNLFDNHPPFQIDGNFGASAAVMEMLLQSHDGAIHLLPALPADKWTSGFVGGLRARGGFEVSICWAEGRLFEASILSLAGQDCKLRYQDKEATFPTEVGMRYVLNAKLELKK